MPKWTLQTLGRKLTAKRQDRGLRETASEIGISSATLSRIERGHLPDLETFRKVCDWLEVDPGEILGGKGVSSKKPRITVHFRKDKTLKPQTAEALAKLILAAQRALELEEKG